MLRSMVLASSSLPAFLVDYKLNIRFFSPAPLFQPHPSDSLLPPPSQRLFASSPPNTTHNDHTLDAEYSVALNSGTTGSENERVQKDSPKRTEDKKKRRKKRKREKRKKPARIGSYHPPSQSSFLPTGCFENTSKSPAPSFWLYLSLPQLPSPRTFFQAPNTSSQATNFHSSLSPPSPFSHSCILCLLPRFETTSSSAPLCL